MKRKRIFIIDEMIESCRLMPTWIQTIFFLLLFGIVSLIIPILSYFALGSIIILQLIFIILLINKNIVYRKISKIEIAVEKMVIWIQSKRDKKEKHKKVLINLALIGINLTLYFSLQSLELLIINSLFCLLFLLKILFYVPLISVRIVEESIYKFFIIDKESRVNIEIDLHQILSIEIRSSKIVVETNQGKVEVPLDFYSDQEVRRLRNFLNQINRFEIK